MMWLSQNSGHGFQTLFPLLEKGNERVWPVKLISAMVLQVNNKQKLEFVVAN